MRTIAMPERAAELAWLEPCATEDGLVEKTCVDRFPFVLGRSDTADLQIHSHRVSREHAVLVHEDREYRVRDLGSTNGTFVNGQRVEETVLDHGDMLTIGDVEFTFLCGRSETFARTVTQAIDPGGREPRGSRRPDVLWQARRLQESMLQGCVRNRYDSIVQLSDGSIFAYEAGDDAACAPAEAGQCERTAAWPVAARWRQLQRIAAVEDVWAYPGAPRIFVRVEPVDLDRRELPDWLACLRPEPAEGGRVVVVLPWAAIRGGERAVALLGRLREVGTAVALDGYAGEAGDLPASMPGPLDFVKLAGPLVRGLEQSSERQRSIQAAVRAGQQGGWKIIATGIRAKEERKLCEELGCTLGQGPLFAPRAATAARRPREAQRRE